MDEATKVPEWQHVIIAFCFTSALGFAKLFAQVQSELSPSFYVLSFATSLIFLSLFVSNLIVHNKLTFASKVLEKVAVIVAATVFVLATTTVAYSEKLKFATWASAISVKKSSSSLK